MRICVFCSAARIDEKYEIPAIEFARHIGRDGHTLVWGGSNIGLMGKIADAAENTGAKLIGVSVELLKHNARPGVEHMLIAKDLGERKALMLMHADVLVVLPGGIGTLDEVTDVLEQKKHHLHDKPIVVLNAEGFYNGLKAQLERMDAEGFLKAPLDSYVHFADTPEDAIRYIEAHGH